MPPRGVPLGVACELALRNALAPDSARYLKQDILQVLWPNYCYEGVLKRGSPEQILELMHLRGMDLC